MGCNHDPIYMWELWEAFGETRYFLLGTFGDIIFAIMKKIYILLPLLAFSLCACPSNNKSNNQSNSQNSVNDGITKVEINLSNFERYVKYTRHEGFTGASGFSPYMAWFEFEGLLSIGVYDTTVTYVVDSTSYNFRLDVSGGGKTDYFDRNKSCQITKVSGTVTYRL